MSHEIYFYEFMTNFPHDSMEFLLIFTDDVVLLYHLQFNFKRPLPAFDVLSICKAKNAWITVQIDCVFVDLYSDF